MVPDGRITVFARALGVEAVGLRHATGLVVAAQEVYARGVAQLEADEQGDGLYAEQTAVDVVTWL